MTINDVEMLVVAALAGHSVIDDSPGPPSRVRRLTCQRCGRTVQRPSLMEPPCGSILEFYCDGVTKEIASAIMEYYDERGLKLTADDASNECKKESAAFMEALADQEVEATVVSGLRIDKRTRMVVAGHFAVKIGDDIWDWTARQFDPAAPVPLVTPWSQWQREWAQASEGWVDPLDDLCPCPVHGGRKPGPG